MATVRGVGSGDTPHEYQTNTYLVNLVLPNGVSMVGVRVVEGSVSGGEILIGMDVIGQGDFAITHHEGKTTWSFRSPSCDEIDFVPSADRHNTRLQRQSPESKKRQRQTRNKTKADKRKPRKK